MASLQRTLVNLEMLSDDINALHVDALNTHAHIKLLHNVLNELKNAEQFVALETEASFKSRYPAHCLRTYLSESVWWVFT